MADPIRIAVTGHRGLPDQTVQLIDAALRDLIAEYADVRPVVGLSCIADGADQLFARAVLGAGGQLEVFVPAERYREGLPADCWAGYDALYAKATAVHRLDHVESTAQAHMDASAQMIDDADLLVAVWDSRPARGYGGTADVVDYARDHDTPVTIVWPAGAHRDAE